MANIPELNEKFNQLQALLVQPRTPSDAKQLDQIKAAAKELKESANKIDENIELVAASNKAAYQIKLSEFLILSKPEALKSLDDQQLKALVEFLKAASQVLTTKITPHLENNYALKQQLINVKDVTEKAENEFKSRAPGQR